MNLFHGAGDDGRVEPENQTAKRRDDSAANHKGLHLATIELAAVLRQEYARFSGVGFSPVLPRYVVRVSFTASVVDLYGIRR